VVGGVRGGDAEADRNLIEKGRIGEREMLPGEVGTGVKDKLVDAGAKTGSSEERRLGSPIGVGANRYQPVSMGAVRVETPELDDDASGGPTLGGIEDVGG
jgi:hypothetical protein